MTDLEVLAENVRIARQAYQQASAISENAYAMSEAARKAYDMEYGAFRKACAEMIGEESVRLR